MDVIIRLKQGAIHPVTGKIFWGYRKKKGVEQEYWTTQEVFQNMKLQYRNWKNNPANKAKKLLSDKKSYLKNKEKVAATAKAYNIKNNTIICEKRKIYRNNPAVKEQRKVYNKKFRQKNSEKIRITSKVWKKRNPDKVRENCNRYYKNKASKDSYFRLKIALRSQIGRAIRLGEGFKYGKSETLLGCTFEEVRKHLESLFKSGMTWENYGYYGWYVDHIKPCSSFDLTKEEEQKKCFHYTNLQPLWAEENLIKNDKILNSIELKVLCEQL